MRIDGKEIQGEVLAADVGYKGGSLVRLISKQYSCTSLPFNYTLIIPSITTTPKPQT